MKLLGIDYGEKNIGIAITDQTNTIVYPFVTVKADTKVFQKIKNIIIENDIKKVILGLPLEISGCIGKSGIKVKNFALKLQKYIDKQIEFFDESFTTKDVQKELKELGIKNKKRISKIDQFSACLILENYIKEKNETY